MLPLSTKALAVPVAASVTACSFTSCSSCSDDDDEDHSTLSSLETTPFTAKADVYGQFHPLESTALLERRLEEFEAVLCQFMVQDDDSNSNKNKQSGIGALHDALAETPSLFRDESLRLMFLRAECFRVQVRFFMQQLCSA
jgi:hypothetical protein